MKAWNNGCHSLNSRDCITRLRPMMTTFQASSLCPIFASSSEQLSLVPLSYGFGLWMIHWTQARHLPLKRKKKSCKKLTKEYSIEEIENILRNWYDRVSFSHKETRGCLALLACTIMRLVCWFANCRRLYFSEYRFLKDAMQWGCQKA